ncbi:hypothetical protein Vi05172_g10391 [Venturia inaequalis]|nr:hypothetical protein Vi05172_g10391 [Venturia inaequalis]
MSSQDPALAAAIKEASKDQLQRILNAIIQIHPDTASTASSLFEAQKPGISEDTRIVSDSGERSPKKRKQVQICAQCKQEYDHAENNARACNWHRGMIESNDESDAGPHSMELVEQFPEAYFWDCCEKSGADKNGCVISEHSTTDLFKK